MELENKIIKWANDRNLYENTTPEKQFNKLHEEIAEWIDEYVADDDVTAEKLELGDIYVVLVNLAAKRGYSLKECGNMAYEKIKNRTGKMIGGTFVKSGIL